MIILYDKTAGLISAVFLRDENLVKGFFDKKRFVSSNFYQCTTAATDKTKPWRSLSGELALQATEG